MCCGLLKNCFRYSHNSLCELWVCKQFSAYIVYLSFGCVPQSTLQFWLCKCFALTNLKSAPQILVIDVLLIINGLYKLIIIISFCMKFSRYIFRMFPSSGDNEIRTRDPLLARQVLSQLSYTPRYYSDRLSANGLKWTRTIDLTLIRRAL